MSRVKARTLETVLNKLKRAGIEFDYVSHSFNGKMVKFCTESGKVVATYRRKADGTFPVKKDPRHYCQ